jgi:Dipeptidyl peptidase IV (DPP IV) N-terminal region.
MKRLLIKHIYKIIVILVALLGYSAIAQADTSTLFVFKQDLFRVYASGKLEKVFSAKEPHSILKISPDQSHVVFEQENDLWLLNVQTKQTARLTNIGEPYTSQYASVSARCQLWSQDSNKILYEVLPGDTDDPEGERPKLKGIPAKYGYYVFDLEKRINRTIELPKGHILFWLADGNFLIYSHHNTLLYDVINNTEVPLISPSNGRQTRLSNNGKIILTNASDIKIKTSQIIKVDMPQGHITPVTPIGKFTEYRWPTFSPSGKRIAYQHSVGTENRHPAISLVVDGRDVYNYRDVYNNTGLSYGYEWIDDSTIVLIEIERSQSEAAIIDVDTKQVKGRHGLK